jgi:hypothetical protein
LNKSLFILCILISYPAYAEKSVFPIPEEVSELVTWTHLCEHWIKAESDSSQELHQDKQNLIDTTPALSWARDNCGYEALESRVITLQEKYKFDPIISYTLDNLIGLYKD